MKEMNKKNALKLIGKASLLAVVSFVLSCLFWLGLLIVVNMKEPIHFCSVMMRVMLMACVHARIAIGILQLAQLFILIINGSALLILIIWIVLELVKRKRLGL